MNFDFSNNGIIAHVNTMLNKITEYTMFCTSSAKGSPACFNSAARIAATSPFETIHDMYIAYISVYPSLFLTTVHLTDNILSINNIKVMANPINIDFQSFSWIDIPI